MEGLIYCNIGPNIDAAFEDVYAICSRHAYYISNKFQGVKLVEITIQRMNFNDIYEITTIVKLTKDDGEYMSIGKAYKYDKSLRIALLGMILILRNKHLWEK